MDLLDNFESKYLASLGRAEVDLSSTVLEAVSGRGGEEHRRQQSRHLSIDGLSCRVMMMMSKPKLQLGLSGFP